MQSRWRKHARSVIAGVVAANPGATGEDLRKLISDAYPFGPRQCHPYKVWLSEVRRAVDGPKPPRRACSDARCVLTAGHGGRHRCVVEIDGVTCWDEWGDLKFEEES